MRFIDAGSTILNSFLSSHNVEAFWVDIAATKANLQNLWANEKGEQTGRHFGAPFWRAGE